MCHEASLGPAYLSPAASKDLKHSVDVVVCRACHPGRPVSAPGGPGLTACGCSSGRILGPDGRTFARYVMLGVADEELMCKLGCGGML